MDNAALRQMVREQYAAPDAPLTFVPVGEDSWSYRLGDLWISIRRDLRGHIPAAYTASRLLHEAGLDFVLAPLPGADGQLAHPVGGRPVLVFPYVTSTTLTRATATPDDVQQVVSILGQVHRCAIKADLPKETYQLTFEEDLEVILGPPLTTTGGPYTAPLLDLITHGRNSILADWAELTDLTRDCTLAADPFVLTHGEPLATNILRSAAGLMLIDWGEAMWATPQRDFVHVARTLGPVPRHEPFTRFYEIRWRLSEIAEYGMRFLGEHLGDDDDAAMWQRLLRYLPAST
ncbi:phosphotransferase [Streptomyces erythrochromogenes]|uniref:phosphotransferase n=1 Tax=Streptomyces erythrochromogenes TaxID=285574 RepID=UPI003645EB0C